MKSLYYKHVLPAGSLRPEGAIAVIRSCYEAINQHDYAQAFRCWADSGAASGQSFEEFERGFAKTVSVEVRLGRPGRQEGTVGLGYITIPVTVLAVSSTQEQQRFEGQYVLRRAVIAGASAAQQAWRIYSADLREAH